MAAGTQIMEKKNALKTATDTLQFREIRHPALLLESRVHLTANQDTVARATFDESNAPEHNIGRRRADNAVGGC